MYEDQPSFIAYENAMKTHFGGHPLGQSILGSKASISALKRDQMAQYHDEHYRGGNITIAVAGNTDWDEVLKLANEWCGKWPAGRAPRPTDEANPKGGKSVIVKDSSTQQHVMQMAAAPSATSALRLAAELLSVIVGDDSGSRLYWDLVDPGLAESADLSYNEYEGSGAYLTYLCSTPESTADNLRRIAAIYDDVNETRRHRRRAGTGQEQSGLAHRAAKRAADGPPLVAGKQLGLSRRIPLGAGRSRRVPQNHRSTTFANSWPPIRWVSFRPRPSGPWPLSSSIFRPSRRPNPL